MGGLKVSREYTGFQALTDRLLAVSKTELDAKMKAYKERAALNPNKRGPKPKGVTASRGRASRAGGR